MVLFDRRSLLLAGASAAFSPAVRAASPDRRLASLDYGLAETLIRLGCPPVALVATQDWNRWVVEPALPADTVNLGASREPNLEVLQALRPDAILSTPYLAGIHHRLERIAPVISLPIYAPEGRPLALAGAAARRLGEMIGDPAAAARFLAEADGCFEQIRDRLADRALPPVYLVNFMDERHVRVYGAKSLFDDTLHRIGLANAWQGPTNDWGFATVGIEALQTGKDALLVYFDPVPPAVLPSLARNPIWRSLSFVRSGRVHGLPPVLMFGCVPSALRFARLVGDLLAERG
ncbi:ABC transporter substrate-binding protein [Bosea sp. RCC_152_1]|uniref:ABC transporter substrate-binding protein n=1 Tax=Bosea sp. RCC_152_1 TaxID=3239228 RepID=UPI003525798A